MRTITCAQARQADQLAVERYHMPSVILMENAARAACDVALSMLPADPCPTGKTLQIAILLGGGNNAGDGYALARHLDRALAKRALITLFALRTPSELKGDAAINARIVQEMNLPMHVLNGSATIGKSAEQWASCDLIIDALLGTGFTGQVRSPMDQVIHACNAARDRGAKVLALDLPSGLDGDTGQPANATVHADVTATFLAAKKGLVDPAASGWVGKIVVCDIGIDPSRLLDDAQRG